MDWYVSYMLCYVIICGLYDNNYDTLYARLLCLSTKSCECECMLFMLLSWCDMNACDDGWPYTIMACCMSIEM